MTQFRLRTYQILTNARRGDKVSLAFDIALITLIALNVSAVIISTVEPIGQTYVHGLWWFEVVSVLVFTAEYIARVWSAPESSAFAYRFGRLRFMLQPMMLIDLLVVAPFWLPLAFGMDTRVLRAFRLFRLMRLLKIGRYSKSMQAIAHVLRAKRPDLCVSIFALSILLVVSSSLMYYAEHEAQPEVFSSIPAALWWGVATLTTVGYGDVCPVTSLGKLIGAVIAVLGIGMFALPAGILASGFTEEMDRIRKSDDGDS